MAVEEKKALALEEAHLGQGTREDSRARPDAPESLLRTHSSYRERSGRAVRVSACMLHWLRLLGTAAPAEALEWTHLIFCTTSRRSY